ncbi:ferredoxin--NADP reductase [Candidatus Hodgkinia cicadicola]
MKFELSNDYSLVRVLEITHYSNRLFSFKTLRPSKFKYNAGEFVMIGLIINGEFVFRAYSICTPSWSNELEFYSIKVLNGPFTTYLQKITTKSSIILKMKSTGTLIIKGLKPGKRLFLLCTGTGVAPFISVIFEPATYENFNEIVIVHTCRYVNELKYLNNKLKQLSRTISLKSIIKNKVKFYTSVTRENYPYIGRITTLIKTGILISDLKTTNLNREDRFMICGSQNMITDIMNLLKTLGYKEGSINLPQDFVYEKSFVTK